MLLTKLQEYFLPCHRSDGSKDHALWMHLVCRLVSIGLLILLSVFVVCSLAFGYAEFTRENIYFFAKDLGTVIRSDNFVSEAIDYEGGENLELSCYRGGLAVAKKNSVSIYSATGRKTATLNNSYLHPVVLASQKYLFVYDEGGKSFSICNSFAELYFETFDNVVYSVSVNDRGEALIHSADSEYNSVIYHYDAGFERVAAYFYTDHVACSAISDDGKYICVVTVKVIDGDFVSVLDVFKRGDENVAWSITVDGSVPLSCGSLAEGFYLMTETGVLVLDREGSTLIQTDFEMGYQLTGFDSDKNALAVSMYDRVSKTFRVSHVSLSGVSTIELPLAPVSFRVSYDTVYVLFDGALVKYNISGESGTFECAPGAIDILLTPGGGAYICYPARAVFLEF